MRQEKVQSEQPSRQERFDALLEQALQKARELSDQADSLIIDLILLKILKEDQAVVAANGPISPDPLG
jgi:hypothetical protein